MSFFLTLGARIATHVEHVNDKTQEAEAHEQEVDYADI
jgi:hypothetical protein